jgi:hypothetical protein
MKIDYWENNQTEISKALDSGQRELEISFSAKGPLRDLPSVYRIPAHIIKEHNQNTGSQFFLNVDVHKEPAEWVIDVGERPL